MCNHAQQEKSTFQWLEIYEITLLDNGSRKVQSNLTVLNSHKERTAKFALPHLNVGGHWPTDIKNCFPGPVRGFNFKTLVSNNILQGKKPARKTQSTIKDGPP